MAKELDNDETPVSNETTTNVNIPELGPGWGAQFASEQFYGGGRANLTAHHEIDLDGGWSFFEGIGEAFKAGVNMAVTGSIEQSILTHYLIGRDVAKEIENNSASTKDFINAEQAKAEFDLDLKKGEVISKYEATMRSANKKAHLNAAARFAEVGFSAEALENPVNLVAAWAAAGAISSFTPTAYALTAALGVVSGPIGGAVGFGGHAAYKLSKLYKVVEAARKAQKIARLRKKLAVTAQTAKANAIIRGIKQSGITRGVNDVVKRGGLAGLANVIEEKGIHAIEREHGYKYNFMDVAPFAFFAPVVFSGVLKTAGGSFKAAKGALSKQPIDKLVTSLGFDVKPRTGTDGAPKKVSKKQTKAQQANAKRVEQAQKILDRTIGDMTYEAKDAPKFGIARTKLKAEVDHLRATKGDKHVIRALNSYVTELGAMDFVYRQFGGQALDDIGGMFAALKQHGLKGNLADVLPQLKNITTARNRLKELRQEKIKNGDNSPVTKDEFFALKPEEVAQVNRTLKKNASPRELAEREAAYEAPKPEAEADVVKNRLENTPDEFKNKMNIKDTESGKTLTALDQVKAVINKFDACVKGG